MLMTAVAALTVKLGYGMHGRKCAGMSELNKAWQDVYHMLEDNAFDYVGKPFYNDADGTIQLWNGSKFITYAEVPF
jgi:hypothetical protein